MAKRFLAVQLDARFRKKLESEAKRRGMTLSALAREKLAPPEKQDPFLTAFVEDFSRRVGLSPAELYEAIAIDFMARHEAEREVLGAPVMTMMPFFKNPDGSQTLGESLYCDLKHAHVSACRQQLLERLREREAAGEELAERERRLMIDYRVGAAWLSSPKFRDELRLFDRFAELGRAAREKGLVPEGIEIPDVELGKLYERVVAGEISEQELKEELSNSFYCALYGKRDRKGGSE